MESLKENKFGIYPKLVLFSFVFLFFFSLNFVSGYGYNSGSDNILNIGNFKQNQKVNLIQTCSNCSFNNLTTIKLPDGSLISINGLMTKDGTFYNYSFSNTTQLGTYIVNGLGDENGVNSVWAYSFNVTSAGSGVSGLPFLIFGILIFGFLILWGWRTNYPWVIVLGAFGILIVGIYTSLHGVGEYKDSITQVISYVLISLGLGFGFESLMKITRY